MQVLHDLIFAKFMIITIAITLLQVDPYSGVAGIPV